MRFELWTALKKLRETAHETGGPTPQEILAVHLDVFWAVLRKRYYYRRLKDARQMRRWSELPMLQREANAISMEIFAGILYGYEREIRKADLEKHRRTELALQRVNAKQRKIVEAALEKYGVEHKIPLPSLNPLRRKKTTKKGRAR